MQREATVNRRMTVPQARWTDAVRAAAWVCLVLAGIGLLVSIMLSAGLLAVQATQVGLPNERDAWIDTATLLVGVAALGGAGTAMFFASDRMSHS